MKQISIRIKINILVLSVLLAVCKTNIFVLPEGILEKGQV